MPDGCWGIYVAFKFRYYQAIDILHLVNGSDRATLIADYATQLEAMLRASLK